MLAAQRSGGTVRKMILETVEKIKKFRDETDCVECADEAQQMIEHLTAPGVRPLKIVFCTDCEHE